MDNKSIEVSLDEKFPLDSPASTFEFSTTVPNREIHDSMIRDHAAYESRRARLRPLISGPPESLKVSVIDILSNKKTEPRRTFKKVFRKEKDLELHLAASSPPQTRIISICAQNSISPLNITESGMQCILDHHNISNDFWDIVFSFRGKPRNSDVGFGSMLTKHNLDGSYDSHYTMVYADEVQTPESQPSAWTLRQIGVFSRHTPTSESDIWIFLHAQEDTNVEKRITAAIDRWERSNVAQHSWKYLNLLVFSSYLINWRFFLFSLNQELEKIGDIALTLEFSNWSHFSKGYTQLRKLRHLEDKVLPLAARFQTTLTTIVTLKVLNETFYASQMHSEEEHSVISNELRAYETHLNGHLITVSLLEKRVAEIFKLLAMALNLKNQSTTVEINHHMLSLTKNTVDDSATVRVVTLVTLIYLPASFISSLLGMNLFAFQGPNDSGFQVSPKFWIFIVLALPLTFITVGSWFIVSRKRRAARSRDGDLELQAKN